MAIRRVGSGPVSTLLAVNLVVYLIILGLAGWSLDKYINDLGGNTSTNFFLMFALISGVIGVCSVMAGFMHLRAWHSDSLAGASSVAIISCSVTALAVGKHEKHRQKLINIIVSVTNDESQQTLEAFVIISLISQLLYLGHLHAGVFR